MPRELSMNGNTKLKTIMQEFNDRFPHLILGFCPSTERNTNPKKFLDFEKTISEVREKKSSDPAIIRGGQKVKNLEKMIDDVFGLYCQVGYVRDGKNFYTSGSQDEMSLRELNAHGEANGWAKDVWHW